MIHSTIKYASNVPNNTCLAKPSGFFKHNITLAKETSYLRYPMCGFLYLLSATQLMQSE